jgi:hypothetical protein
VQNVFDADFRKRFEQGVRDFGKIEAGANGLVSFEDFMRVQVLISSFVNEATHKRMAEHKKTRREYLKEQKDQQY